MPTDTRLCGRYRPHSITGLPREYASSNTWSGKLPQDAPRVYTLFVYAREQGTQVASLVESTGLLYETKAPLTALAMTVSPSSPQLRTVDLTITAVPTGGVNLEYAFKASYVVNGTVTVLTLQNYSNTIYWSGKLPQDAARSYVLYVYAREKGTSVNYLKMATMNFTTK